MSNALKSKQPDQAVHGYRLGSLKLHSERTIVRVGNVELGRGFVVIAGPCAVESQSQITEIAAAAKAAGADILRGGAFKPRTSPYSFHGLGLKGLKFMRKAGDSTGLPIVSEVLDPRDVAVVSEYVDALQIGSRNMQNFALLNEVGKTKKPVLLKRGMSATIEEWLCAAEYILAAGNPNVILCERGIRAHDPHTRNTLDLAVVPALHELTHLPVIVDPSHGTGVAGLVEPMSLAALACGADGIMVEVHRKPAESVSDGEQTLSVPQFTKLMSKIRVLESTMQSAEFKTEASNAAHASGAVNLRKQH